MPLFYAATAVAAIAVAYTLPATLPTDEADVVIVEDAAASDVGKDKKADGEAEGEHAVDPSKAQGKHGAAVSTVAHCPIKGRAHGELVRSIAQDKDATVEDARIACDDAIAEAEAAGESLKTKPIKAPKASKAAKPDKGTPPGQAKKATDVDVEDDAEESTEVPTEDAGHGGGPPADKGKPDKP